MRAGVNGSQVISPQAHESNLLFFALWPRMEQMMDQKKKAVLDRIKHFEEAITKAIEYLEDGRHANWKGFRPLFSTKRRGGKELPPHRDWVKNVFLPRMQQELSRDEKVLERLT